MNAYDDVGLLVVCVCGVGRVFGGSEGGQVERW